MPACATSEFGPRASQALGGDLMAQGLDILQVNVGYKCNLSCKHCHIGGGPTRPEGMDAETVEQVLHALGSGPFKMIDITGGAPEMNPSFRRLVTGARAMGIHVISRSNLTIFYEPGYEWVPEFLSASGAEVIASLPYYLDSGVDRVRGTGVFVRSIEALRRLNSLGYARGGALRLNLVYNPQGAFLTPDQAGLEAQYKRELASRHGVAFDRLYTFCNMPIGRFREFLVRTGGYEKYMARLAGAFNPGTLEGVMCRRLISVGHDGRLYDCDFNLAMGLGLVSGMPSQISEFDYAALSGRAIAVGDHCYGCTAGQGST